LAHYSIKSRTEGAEGYPRVNARYLPDEYVPPTLSHQILPPVGASEKHWEAEWCRDDIEQAVEENVMLSWGATKPIKDLPLIVDSDGCYLITDDGRRLLDWTSQAVCCNFGHTVPQQIKEAVMKQMDAVSYVYGGMGIVPIRARLAKLMRDITPGDITGFLFPSGGGEANEAAIRMARRYTGRNKIMTQYRSYHGGTAHSLGATGDARRWFTETNVSGFVKIFNPQPFGFTWGSSDEQATIRSLQALEEQIIVEGPGSIAAILLESVVGAGGVLVPPVDYMQGVRALCDKYNLLFILDEVMAGFGRTGKMWAFEHFHGVLPDIVTSAKGLTGAIMPLSVVGVRQHVKEFFQEHPLGWGSTYHAHPVALACAYEAVKYGLRIGLADRAQDLEYVMLEEIQTLIDRHPCVKQGRAIGLFGCVDLREPSGRNLDPNNPLDNDFRKAMTANGLIGLFRPPLLHATPPLIITEDELRDGFRRVSKSLQVFDAAFV
jgi:adenosylmethionine-8-amino-7-oxononanoate aminotransferase